MATTQGTGAWYRKGVHKQTWLAIPNGNDGSTLSAAGLSDKSVQVTGTFGAGGTLIIEGSNDGGTTWATLNDTRGETTGALSFTGADLRTILENVELIRPRVTAGDGTTSLNVYILSKGQI